MNRLDATLQAVCPTVMVPAYEPLEPLGEPGHRFLTAKDAEYLELRRSWVYAVLRGAPTAFPKPYGHMEPRVDFHLPGLMAHLAAFIAEAARVLPDEHAAWLSAPADGIGPLRYEPVEALSQSAVTVRYRRPALVGRDRVLAVDLHSHGCGEAGFSEIDDVDALDDAKLEIVVGHLHLPRPSFACRFSALGLGLDYSKWLASLWIG